MMRDALIGLLVMLAAVVAGYTARVSLRPDPVPEDRKPCGLCLEHCEESGARGGYEYRDGDILCRCDCGAP